jgi:hypothetical protein
MAESASTKLFLACAAASIFFVLAMRIPIGPEFLTGTLLACLIFHFWLRPGKSEMLLVAALASAFAGARLHFGTPVPPDVHFWACVIFMLGLSSLLVQSVWLPFAGGDFKRRSTAFTAGVACVLFLMFSTAPLLFSAAHTPSTFDLYLLLFDRALGGDVSFWFGRKVQSTPMFLYPVAFAYGGLALDAAVVVGSQLFEQQTTRKNLLLVLGAAGAAGLLLYTVVPATGPRFVFPDFPQIPTDSIAPRLITVDSTAMRNAVPSLHFTWTLLLLWMARNARVWVRWIALAFVVLTFVATMALGQHYFVDLIVALPFTIAVIAFSERSFRIATIAGAMLATWLIALRFFPVLALRFGRWNWLPVLLTIAGCVVLLRRLPRRERFAADGAETALRLDRAGSDV